MKTKIFIYAAIILLLQFPCNIFAEDNDGDGIDDNLEEQIAYKFAPVLHRHSWDLQEGLQNFDLIVENPSLSSIKIWSKILGQEITESVQTDSNSRIHKWRWNEFGTFGRGYRQSERAIQFIFDPNKIIQHESAEPGERPIYYHIYKDQCHLYLQYWYYFTMNDLREHDQTLKKTYHESDWEHVTLQLHKNSNIDYVFPCNVNFYRHEGGRTFAADQCWWSTSGTDTTYDSTKLQKGYDENHTHLHIWLAANSHASYNRGSSVLQLEVHLSKGNHTTLEEKCIDNVDFKPTGYDLYFTYDTLENLGEVEVTRKAHNYTWYNYHMSPKGSLSKNWLGYQYIMGDDFWKSGDKIFGGHIISYPIIWRYIPEQYLVFVYAADLPTAATLPPFGLTSPVQPWMTWEDNYSEEGFGNESFSKNYWIVAGTKRVLFVNDFEIGD